MVMEHKVLFFIESLGAGGAERQLCGLAIGLKRKGFDVRVIYFVDNFFYAKLLDEHNICHEFHGELKKQSKRVFNFLYIAKSLRPDIVISFLPGPCMAACLARPFCGYKLIVGERNTNIRISNYDRFVFNLYRFADAVVPNSYAQAEFIDKKFHFLSKKVHPIVNFVDSEYFCLSETKPMNKVANIITVARFTSQKNYLRYIEAIAIVIGRGYKLNCNFYGNQSETEYVASMKSLIKKFNLEGVIALHQPTKNIVECYHESDALCLPSIYEGYPNVLCEAMSTGLPVMCSNVVEMPRIVKEDVNGYLFAPYNPEDIARGIIKFLKSSADTRKMQGENNRKQILENNTMEFFADRYESLINKLCK